MTCRIGVDIGGTFTDFCLVHDEAKVIHLHKQLTTPHDPSASVLRGLDLLLSRLSLQASDLDSFVHGSTLVTNALIERRGAKSAMVVTKGFRDLIDMGFERRYDLFDLRLRFPDPLVPRGDRIEVLERIRFDGTVEKPLTEDEMARVLAFIKRGAFDSVSICFIHSYANSVHEQLLSDYLRRHVPATYVSASSVILPYIREYERWTTSTMNAYVQPTIDRYLGHIETGLRQRGFAGNFQIMTSSGGTITPEIARLFPVRMLESGPAAGVLMSAVLGESVGKPDLLSFDLGGTTAKGALVKRWKPSKRYEMEVARIHKFKKGSGLPVKIPTIDLIEIGVGGGSIATIDDRGILRMGPRSAGAVPGPACYGRGGRSATLTDANLLLGYLDPDYFLGGEMKLDKQAAAHAIETNVAKPLGVEVLQAAWGMHEVINEDVARAFRVHASERGFDYRRSGMIAFGGGGPLHGVRVAKKLRIPEVIFPIGAGVMSAFGMLASPLLFESAKTIRISMQQVTPKLAAEAFDGLVQEAAAMLEEAGVATADMHFSLRLDMRFRGQGYEVEVERPTELTEKDFVERLPELFYASYRKIFGTAPLEGELEIVNWKVEASGPRPNVLTTCHLGVPRGGGPAKTRSAYFPDIGEFIDCPVYDRYALAPSASIDGPALIEERESTCVIGTGDTIEVDRQGNLLARLKTATLPDVAVAGEFG